MESLSALLRSIAYHCFVKIRAVTLRHTRVGDDGGG